MIIWQQGNPNTKRYLTNYDRNLMEFGGFFASLLLVASLAGVL